MSDKERSDFVASKIEGLDRAIKNKFESEAACSRALGWDRQRLNKITIGKMLPDVNDLNALSVVLEISVGELAGFFITEKSPNEQQSA
jgi:hypothetical protein